ncbi:MAG: DUF3024 domain-containing protein [Bacteroidales bacterium]|jgi:hypothetical protein|nr:DUF3024 domain-containing protein [Bacteroidales bacterium]
MALDILQSVEIIETMENYIESIRPHESIRHNLDIAYKIENQSIIIYEIRPLYLKPGKYIDSRVAKTTYVHTQKVWKIYWLRASGKWESYTPVPEVKTLNEFLEVIDDDSRGTFWG